MVDELLVQMARQLHYDVPEALVRLLLSRNSRNDLGVNPVVNPIGARHGSNCSCAGGCVAVQSNVAKIEK